MKNLILKSETKSTLLPINPDTYSIYKGVRLNRITLKWIAAIYLYGNRINLGEFDSEIEAAEQHLKAKENKTRFLGCHKSFRNSLKNI